jgi:hypothetical protein
LVTDWVWRQLNVSSVDHIFVQLQLLFVGPISAAAGQARDCIYPARSCLSDEVKFTLAITIILYVQQIIHVSFDSIIISMV